MPRGLLRHFVDVVFHVHKRRSEVALRRKFSRQFQRVLDLVAVALEQTGDDSLIVGSLPSSQSGNVTRVVFVSVSSIASQR